MNIAVNTQTHRFLSPEWAEAARSLVDGGPDDDVVARKQESYWEWIAATREGYSHSWALGVRRQDRGTSFLVLRWQDGACAAAEVVDDGSVPDAEFVVVGAEKVWRRFFAGELNLQRMVVDRQLRLEHGDILKFFQGVFFFVESLAALERVPTSFG